MKAGSSIQGAFLGRTWKQAWKEGFRAISESPWRRWRERIGKPKPAAAPPPPPDGGPPSGGAPGDEPAREYPLWTYFVARRREEP